MQQLLVLRRILSIVLIALAPAAGFGAAITDASAYL